MLNSVLLRMRPVPAVYSVLLSAEAISTCPLEAEVIVTFEPAAR